MHKKTDSFVCELPLKVTPAQSKKLEKRLDAARQIYNACLGEGLVRLGLMRESRDWQRARSMPRGAERAKLLGSLAVKFKLSKSALDRVAIRCKNEAFRDHLGPHEAQAMAYRAFQAVRQFLLGNRGRPRFKGRRGLHGVEAKTNAAGIRWREGAVHWKGLVLAAMLAPEGRDGWQREALSGRTKYCRIVRRGVRGRERWFVQLIQEGKPPCKSNRGVGSNVVGLDLGPSTIALVGETEARLDKFCPTVEQPWAEVRRIQRAMDRSRRATNPDNYNPDGTVKKGARAWRKSGRYRKLVSRCAETERRLAAERKRAHGELSNEILALGKTIRTEKLSYRAFQKVFGRSVKVRGPGLFLSMLRRKAESAGGEVEELPTRTTRLSQICHGCERARKKDLSERIHSCACGVGPVQRDLYSAFLARHVSLGQLDVRKAREAFPAAEPLLRRAASRFEKLAREGATAALHANGVRAGRSSNGDSVPPRSRKSYRKSREGREEVGRDSPRTPWL
jgi:putative transposase